MYIRQTKTNNSNTGEEYITFRLVESQRTGSKVSQRTLLNLGRHFSVPKEDWKLLCERIEQILSAQSSLPISSTYNHLEKMAQRYAAQLVANRKKASEAIESKDKSLESKEETAQYQEVDVNSMELVRPRSVGVEHVGLSALSWLGVSDVLKSLGMNGVQRACALGNIVGRMARPGSELSTYNWLQNQSAFGELVDVDFEGIPSIQLYRASDLLIRHRDAIEKELFNRINSLFSLPTTVTLYDLTNTYFEGDMAGNEKAKHGHSKEKRTDCPLLTLGLVLDGSGFVRRSRMFEGNVSECQTLEGMLNGLCAPGNALVIMDRGIATETNITWLKENNYRYLVVSRERVRQFDMNDCIDTTTASGETIKIQRVVSEDEKEVRLYCYSEKRQEKENAMTRRFSERFEEDLKKLSEGLGKPRCTKSYDKVLEKIGRLKEKSHGIGQHYKITVNKDDSGKNAISLTWENNPVDGTLLTHPGVYCLRSNETTWDEAKLWKTYTMLTDLEAVFRSLKSELGLRPVYHHKAERADGHLFITVLAYQAVQAIRTKLKEWGITSSWSTLREILSVQQRVTASFLQRNGKTLNVRKATVAEKSLSEIYEKLNISQTPGGICKLSI